MVNFGYKRPPRIKFGASSKVIISQETLTKFSQESFTESLLGGNQTAINREDEESISSNNGVASGIIVYSIIGKRRVI